MESSSLTSTAGRYSSLISNFLPPVEPLLILWFFATPLASFYFRFPAEKSILTFDRAVFAVVVVLLALKSTAPASVRPRVPASRFELAWALLSILTVVSVATKSNNVGYAARIAVDSFLLPLIAFHVARYHFELRGRASALLFAAMALGLVLLTIGAYEFWSGTDLFQFKGSELIRAGERRVNGPFTSDSSYAIICLMLSVFLASAPRLLGTGLDRSARLVFHAALVSTIIASLLPMFRIVGVAAVICLAIILSSKSSSNDLNRGLRVRRSIAAILILLPLLAASVIVIAPSLGRRLTDPRNIYGRLATWQTAAMIIIENPVFGVGLTNYTDYFSEKYFGPGLLRESVADARAAASPHSNPLWVAAELGSLGFVLYLAANVYIFMTGYRAWAAAQTSEARAAARCFMALIAAYWLPGLALTSGLYSDANLYFFFLLGLLSKNFLGTAINNTR
jgi:O-antigen ligase